MFALWLLAAPANAAGCGGSAPPLRPLAPGLWLVQGAGGEADAGNGGFVDNIVLAADGDTLWAAGSGPTPAFGRRLRCGVLAALGRPVTDLVSPWARAEMVLGARGLGARRHWAHAQVQAAMREQCPVCVERLRQRLGRRAADLGASPVSLPARVLRGASGRLGPFDWWVLPRAPARVVTVLRHRASGIVVAPGLLWGEGPPDTRDADLALMAASLEALAQVPAASWVGQQGPPLPAAAASRQAAYLRELRAAAAAAVAAGRLDQAAPPLEGAEHPRHALNWQRAWRQAEDALMTAPSR